MGDDVGTKREGSCEPDGGGDGDGAKRAKSMACFDVVSEGESGGGDMMAWLNLDDETMTELSKLLDPETASLQQEVRVRFIDDPYSPPVIFKSSAYVTINGNEESCGSSFSDQESSVMANIDMGGVTGAVGGWARKDNGCAWGPDANVARGWTVEHEADMGLGNFFFGNEMDGEDWPGCYIDAHDEDSMWVKFLDEELV